MEYLLNLWSRWPDIRTGLFGLCLWRVQSNRFNINSILRDWRGERVEKIRKSKTKKNIDPKQKRETQATTHVTSLSPVQGPSHRLFMGLPKPKGLSFKIIYYERLSCVTAITKTTKYIFTWFCRPALSFPLGIFHSWCLFADQPQSTRVVFQFQRICKSE